MDSGLLQDISDMRRRITALEELVEHVLIALEDNKRPPASKRTQLLAWVAMKNQGKE
jgi:hypothetical protein